MVTCLLCGFEETLTLLTKRADSTETIPWYSEHYKSSLSNKSGHVGFIRNVLLSFNFYVYIIDCIFFLLVFFFSGLHPWHTEVPRLRVILELQLLAYTTATATQDPNCVWDLNHSSWQCWILNPLSEEARDQTRILMDTCRVCYY